jgi:hypothetical protein
MSILKYAKAACAAAILVTIYASPAASLGLFPRLPHKDRDQGNHSVGTPAPIAGIGIVGIGVVGAALYMAVRRYRKPDRD